MKGYDKFNPFLPCKQLLNNPFVKKLMMNLTLSLQVKKLGLNLINPLTAIKQIDLKHDQF